MTGTGADAGTMVADDIVSCGPAPFPPWGGIVDVTVGGGHGFEATGGRTGAGQGFGGWGSVTGDLGHGVVIEAGGHGPATVFEVGHGSLVLLLFWVVELVSAARW